MRIEQVVRPPELPKYKQRKRIDMAAMSAVYFAALAILLAVVGMAAWSASSGGADAPVLLALAGVFITYVILGGALCAFFLRRLAWWRDASLEEAVAAKMNFIWTWPWAAGRLLTLLLLFHVLA